MFKFNVKHFSNDEKKETISHDLDQLELTIATTINRSYSIVTKCIN